jgi:hypothetical protein
MKNVIRLDDPTPHGGKVISAKTAQHRGSSQLGVQKCRTLFDWGRTHRMAGK